MQTDTDITPMRLVKNNGVAILDWSSPDKRNPGISLKPGINEVPEEQIKWIESETNKDETKGNKLWRFHMRKETIAFVELETEADEKTSALSFDDLHDLKTDEAVKLVEGVHDIDVLRGWQIKEERKGVGAAIAEKIKKLTPRRNTVS